jgi:hypothetical protein
VDEKERHWPEWVEEEATIAGIIMISGNVLNWLTYGSLKPRSRKILQCSHT